MISVLNSPLIVSARALSQLEPTDPTEAAMPSSESRSDKEIKVYWAGSTGRCSTLVWEVSVVAARYWSVEASEVPGGCGGSGGLAGCCGQRCSHRDVLSGLEMVQVFFRSSGWENLEYAKEI